MHRAKNSVSKGLGTKGEMESNEKDHMGWAATNRCIRLNCGKSEDQVLLTELGTCREQTNRYG